MFDEVIPEKQYQVQKLEKRTLDVMTRKDDYYVFFDSKSFSPKRDVRIFSETAFREDVVRLAKSCQQVNQQIHDKFPTEYNYFKFRKVVDFEKVFGLVVVREDAYILGEHIYLKAAELIGIDPYSNDYKWLCGHVGIVSIFDIERFCFTSSDIINAICAKSRSGKINDFWLAGSMTKGVISNKNVRVFKHKIANTTKELGKQLLQKDTIHF